ncbi:MAG TPA: pyridoxamine 5'-phosphate oxidase family protein [Roseiflexaceae bacterium]|nr:pyridoxamine 5'-phosphate oxidase family protein [Roseiflexaceae bacterium]
MSWQVFEEAAPATAAYAVGRLAGRVAYLATVRPDGGPRVHPVTPIVGAGRLFLFMEPTSPKGRDLQRDGRYALHCGVEDNSGGEGEVLVNGRGVLVDAPTLRAAAIASASYQPNDRYILFELLVERVDVTIYEPGGVRRERWRAEGVA